MNKSKAKRLAYYNELTNQQLIDIIDKTPRDGKSNVNNKLPKEFCLNFMRSFLVKKEPDAIPETQRFKEFKPKRKILTGDGLNVMNIFIECLE